MTRLALILLTIVLGLQIQTSFVQSFILGPDRRGGLEYGMGGMGDGAGLPMMGSRYGRMQGGARVHGRVGTVNSFSRNSNMAHFPAGVKMVDGELMDITNKVIQKAGTVGGGTRYFSFMNPRGPPIFRRREVDVGRHFIVFPDANYLPGDGHYIVLRKVRGMQATQYGGPMYEAFYLDLGDSINALVSNWNSQTYDPPNLSRTGQLAMANSMQKLRGRVNG